MARSPGAPNAPDRRPYPALPLAIASGGNPIMNAPVSSFVLFLLVLLGAPSGALAQDTADDAQDTTEESQEGAGEEPSGPTQVVDVGAVRPPVTLGTAIPDIDAHRIERLEYVRPLEDVVELDLSGVDPTAEILLVAGDEPLTRDQFRRRALVYAWMDEVDKHITRVLTLQQIERNVAAGADPAEYAIDEADLDRKVEEVKEMFRMQAEMQGGDPEQAVADFESSVEDSIGWEEYRRLVAADALFEKVFLPIPTEKTGETPYDYAQGPPPADMPCPSWCPPVTWDALGIDDQGRNLRVFVHNYAIDGEDVPSIFKANVLGQLRIGLCAKVGVAYFFDEELPDDAFVRVGEQLIGVDELWATMTAPLPDTDVELAIREELTLRAMRDQLEAAGRWLDRDAFAQAWAAHEAEYVGTLFPLRNIILFRGYQSLDRYREHYRYRRAFELWQRDELDDETVLEHYQRGGRLFFEQGEVRVELAFAGLPVDDQGRPVFSEAGFADAQARLEDAMARHGDDWTAVQAEFPPLAVQSPAGDGKTFQRSPFRMRIAESELSMFVTGYSLADDAFYRGVPGEVFGPWPQKCRRHAWGAESNAGVWAGKVVSYLRRKPLGAFEGAARDLAWSDYLDLRYFDWAQDSLASVVATIERP